MTPDEIEELISVVLGPEEEWTEADAQYVLRLYGVNPDESSKYACDLILRMIDEAREKGEVPAEYMNILWDLTSEEDKETDVIAGARRAIEEMQQMPFPPQLAAAKMTQHFREKRDLSERDKEILEGLEAKLFQEASKFLDSK